MSTTALAPVAVIGMSARFPHAPDIAAFWRLLDEGGDAVSVIPPDRWPAEALYDPRPGQRGKMTSRWGAFLDDIRGFDAPLFGITPREARDMDPQQRLLLECAWATFESAGYAPDRIAGSATGVFVGIGANDYSQVQLVRRGHRDTITAYSGTGQAHSIGANRISYTFDLRGPSFAIDTACSSSLVAIHQAVRSLAVEESRMALAGGVSIVLAPEVSIAFSHAQMLAADGRCKSFDARADGYVRGEGCGLVLLKPLADALRDGDPVYGVIAGSAINQDGRSNGLTAPNGRAQADVVRQALESAGVGPERIGYVEAHGTGTPLGDPIELNALATALDRPDTFAPAIVGSVKTNIGHLECASGIAGFLKALLAIRHERIPANLHFEQLNPAISLGSTLRIATTAAPWSTNGAPRYAGVSSYGFGGANAHVVLTEAPPLAASADARRWHVMTLSAKTDTALACTAERLRDGLDAFESIADVAFTSSAGRAHFGHRCAVAVSSIDDLSAELGAIVDGHPSSRVHVRHSTDFARPRVGFLFSGQGAQYVGMGRELYASCADFQQAFDRCCAVLDPLLDEPLASVFDGSGAPDAIDRTGNTQPALFALEYALASAWIAWGVVPHALLGHSVGEFAAAAIGGMLTLEDAARLVAHRARLMQALPPGGAMAALLEPAAAVRKRLQGYESQADIASVNGPASTVISGAAAAVDEISERARADGVQVQRLNVSHAFHSPLMEPMLGDFAREAARIRSNVPQTITISNVTGEAHAAAPTAEYWCRHVREPVAFLAGVEELARVGCDVLLEIGPDATLSGLAKNIGAAAACAVLPSLRRGRDAWRTISDATAALYARNAPLKWRAVYRGEHRRIVALPTYPFEHQHYWFGDEAGGHGGAADETTTSTPTGNPLLGRRIDSAAPLFAATISFDALPFLRDHAIDGRVVLPASAFVEIALAAGDACDPGDRREVANVAFLRPLVLDEGERYEIQTAVRTTVLGDFEVDVQVRRSDRWTLLATATLRRRAYDFVRQPAPDPVLERIDGPEFYGALRSRGYGYGPAFAALQTIDRGENEAAGTVVMPAELRGETAYRFHPALLDACFHVAAATASDKDDLFIPASIESLHMHGAVTPVLRVTARRRPDGDTMAIVVDLTIETRDGAPVASIIGFRAQRLGRDNATAATAPTAPTYYVAWTPAEPAALEPVALEPAVLESAVAAPAALALAVAAPARRCSLGVGGPRAGRLAEALAAIGWTVDVAPDARLVPGDVVVVADALDADDDALVFDLVDTARRALEASASQLIVVTAGAQKILADDVVAPSRSAIWGAARTIGREHPELGLVLLDLPQQAAAVDDGGEALAAAAVANARRHEELAVRDGALLRASLVARTSAAHCAGRRVPAGPYVLRSTQRRRLDSLRPVPVTRGSAGADQIVIETEAAGLNFRDVMKALGMYPSTRPDGDWLGDECAGTVVEVGPGVSQFHVGDRVVAFAPASFGRYATTLAALAAPIPPELDTVVAAALPVAFGTSWYALNDLARLQRGERVLIHAASGGVGLAAVAVAKHLGAEIFATAGSDEKRALLRSLGIESVFDSRSLAFDDGIRERTGGAGVDVVLNSLSGEALTATLSLVAPFGRFIEIGKKDIYANSPLPMRLLARNVSVTVLDMDELLADRPAVGGGLLRTILPLVVDGTLPAPPVTTFGVGEAVDAFRMMAQARHIGKIVLMLPPAVRGGCAVVSGGFGGLGPFVGGWLHERGFETIVLTGRSEPDETVREAIEGARAAGATIVCERMDVADAASVAETLERVRNSYGPIQGVVHLAGVLDDGIMLQQTRSRFAAVAAPKVSGVRHLHDATFDDPLELFVVFSSAAAILGSPGQSAYAAANAYLEGFVHERRRSGRPALCVHFGPWAQVGMAARTQRLNAGGAVAAMEPANALGALGEAVDDGRAVATVLDAEWSAWRGSVPDPDAYPLVRSLLPACETTAADAAADVARARLAALTPAERRAWLGSFIAGELARVMETDRSTLALDQPIRDLGVDSLMGLELQVRLEQEFKVVIPRMLLTQSPTIADFANIVGDAISVE